MGNLIEDPALRDRLHVFVDRTNAGQQLAARLEGIGPVRCTFLPFRPGACRWRRRSARALSIPLDLIIVRKIQLPWTTEAGFGALIPPGRPS